MAPSRNNWLTNGLLLMGGLLTGLLFVEVLLFVLLSKPTLIAAKDGSPSRVLSTLRQYFKARDRATVQFEPECFRYDAEVTYTLKRQSSCTVVNREHTVEYRSNRQGLRDSDSALEHPSIVVLGDSFAMGWGVAQSESFPKVLEQELKLPVLNTAISSYGTAREFAMLARLQLPDFPVLVIQYCNNDFAENKFLVDKGALRITPEAQFRSLATRAVKRRRYYPFKHTIEIFKQMSASLRAPQSDLDDSGDNNRDNDEARYFLEVLLRNQKLIQGKTVLVIELTGRDLNDGRFIEALTAGLKQPRYAALAHSVVPLDLSKMLTSADYYVLDDHLTRTGHTKVARAIAAELSRRPGFAGGG